jgi:O-antigen ligase
MSLERAGLAGLFLLAPALISYVAFDDGGFFPATVGVAAVVIALTLVVRTTSAPNPFGGLSPALGVAVGALGLFGGWVLLSRVWSHAPARSTVEFDRVLLYMLTLLLFGSIARTAARVRWMVRALVLAVAAICIAGLASRLLPDTFPVGSQIASFPRLNYPVTYWNTLGLIGSLGTILCLHLSSAREEPRATRVLATALVPVLAVTVYLTFSRGGIAAGAIGIAAYVVLVRRLGTLAALAAMVPPTLVAVTVAYHADALASTTPTGAHGVSQGHHVALVVAICAVAAAALRWAISLLETRRLRPDRAIALARYGRLAWLGGLLALIVVLLAANAPAKVSHQYHRFISGDTPTLNGDLRNRLTQVGNNGRTQLWDVSLDDFKASPFHGTGAGTYQVEFERASPPVGAVKDGHGLYFETLGELGIVGLLLLLTCVLTMLGVALYRFLKTKRSVYAAVFAVTLAWSIRAGVDWDWEMPSVTLFVFVLGGMVLAANRRTAERTEPWPAQSARIPIAIAWLVVAAFPWLVVVSERHIGSAQAALRFGHCQDATDDALAALSAVPDQGRAFEIVAFCDLRNRKPRAAMQAIDKAIAADPDNWQYRFDMAIARAQNAQDPRSALAQARVRKPREREIQLFAADARGRSPVRWRQAGLDARAGLLLLGEVGDY